MLRTVRAIRSYAICHLLKERIRLDMSVQQFLLSLLIVCLGVLTASTPVAAQPDLTVGSEMPLSNERFATSEGSNVRLSGLAGNRGTVVMFWSNQCPWASRYEQRVQELVDQYASQGIAFVLVNSNDPAAFPKESASASRQMGYSVPYVMDPEGRLARAFGAARIPHVFLFDAGNALRYRGTIDDSPGDPGNVTQPYLRDAVSALVEGQNVQTAQSQAFGCMLKLR